MVEFVPVKDINNPDLVCYDSVCRRITAVWQSFGHAANTQRLRINRSATLDTDSSSSPPDATDALLEAVRVLTTTLQNAGAGGPRPGSAILRHLRHLDGAEENPSQRHAVMFERSLWRSVSGFFISTDLQSVL